MAGSTIELEEKGYTTIDNSLFYDSRDRSKCPFQVLLGGRGIGKTYSSLRNVLFDENMQRIKVDKNNKFMYMRRLGKEIELSATDAANPFKSINRDYATSIMPDMVKKHVVFYDEDSADENGTPLIVGYGAALSTFSGLRGVDFTDVSTIIFDEFIPETQVRRMKNEGKIFLNMYETINRNRELQGRPPCKIILLANSITVNSEILLEMGAVPVIAGMIMHDQHKATIKERGLYIELIDSSKFAKFKEQTALYKLTKNSNFNREALLNQFTGEKFDFVKKVNINEYLPKMVFADYTFYKHKSREEYYMRKARDKAPIIYENADLDRLNSNFRFTYIQCVLSRAIKFDDYATKLVFDTLLNV